MSTRLQLAVTFAWLTVLADVGLRATHALAEAAATGIETAPPRTRR